MKVRVTTRTSLFARMSLLFGLLVTVPLVISGIVLSLAGWQSVHRSGSEVKDVSRTVLDGASTRIKAVTNEELKKASDKISALGQGQVDAATRRAVDIGTTTLKDSNTKMKGAAAKAIQEANQDLVRVSGGTVDKALQNLSTQHKTSLDRLSNRFLEEMRASLTVNAKPVQDLEDSLVASWQVTAERRAVAVGDWTETQVNQLVRQMENALRTFGVNGFNTGEYDDTPEGLEKLARDRDRVRQLLTRLISPSYTDLSIQRVVLVSELGEEYCRSPETDLPAGRPAPDWEGHSTRTQLLATDAPYRVEPARVDDLSGKWILRIAVKSPMRVERAEPTPDPKGAEQKVPAPAQMAPPAESSPRFLVVDVLMDSIVERAVVDTGKTPVMVIGSATGTVISRHPKDTGPVSPRLLEKLGGIAPAEYVSKKADFNYIQEGAKQLGVARYWPLAKCWLVVTQPDTTIRAEAIALQEKLFKAGTSSVIAVQGSGTKFIDQQVAEATKKQRDLTESARAEMKRVADERLVAVEDELGKTEANLVKTVPTQLKAGIGELQGEIKKKIESESDLITAGAQRKVSHAADLAKSTAATQIDQQAGRVANRAAGQMIFNSAWLIPLFLILAYFLAVQTARSLVRPINQLAVGTQALAAGEYEQRIEVKGEDELSRLALAFNGMAGAIQRGQTELQASHDVLAAEKLRIQAIAESSPDGLVMFEPGDLVGFINPTAIRLLHLPDLLPPAPFDIAMLPPAAAVRLQEVRQRAQAGDAAQEYEHAEPERRVLQVREVQLRSPGGKSHGCLLHLHDITRDRVIDEMKSDFVSLVSHELRTPLVSILGFSSYMLTGKMGQVSDTHRTAVESINRQAKRLSAIISDFLDISRIESGKVEIARRPVPVVQIAEKVVEDLKPQASEKCIFVEAVISGSEPSTLPVVALGDEARITQVLTNLVGNALKFTEREGSVRVLLSRMNGEVVCRVRDSGCGIPPDELDRVFDRFYQVEKVVTRKTGGTGLGLAIVKNIVEAHGGRVWIESQVGEGTTVSFTLPATDPVPAEV